MTDPTTILGLALLGCFAFAMVARYLMDRRRVEADDIDWLSEYRREP